MPKSRPVKVTVVLEFTGNSSLSYSALTDKALERVGDIASKRDFALSESLVRSVQVEDTGI